MGDLRRKVTATTKTQHRAIAGFAGTAAKTNATVRITGQAEADALTCTFAGS
jgi:hypothetical protein